MATSSGIYYVFHCPTSENDGAIQSQQYSVAMHTCCLRLQLAALHDRFKCSSLSVRRASSMETFHHIDCQQMYCVCSLPATAVVTYVLQQQLYAHLTSKKTTYYLDCLTCCIDGDIQQKQYNAAMHTCCVHVNSTSLHDNL
eukprot:13451-Heterococcus_DN1.PRE.1